MARRRRRRAVPAPVVMTSIDVSLHVENTCELLNSLPIEQLDGLHSALLSKLKDLGHGPRPRAHQSHPTTGGGKTGSISGILFFVKHAASDDDVRKLQTLEAIITARHEAAGYKPKAAGPLT